MRRKIWIEGERYALCDVKQGQKHDYYQCLSHTDIEVLKKAMIRNGYCIEKILSGAVVVDKSVFSFMGEIHELNQCSDIFAWFAESKEGDFTYYYDRIVFHHKDGNCYAAYIEDTSNYIKV